MLHQPFWLQWALSMLTLSASLASGQSVQTPYGAYLGCFNPAKLPVDAAKFAKFSSSSINKCMPYCGGQQHSIHAISASFQCWCMNLIPDAAAQLPDAECNSGGSGVAVFYRHKDASKQMCRLAPVPLNPSSFEIHYNEANVVFSEEGGEAQMTMVQHGPDGTRLATNDGKHLYGQYQVTAKIAAAPGVVTAFYVRSTDVYTLTNNDSPFSEIDVEFLNAQPAKAPSSIWLNSYKNGLSGGETLVGPQDYQKLLNLSGDATAGNTWITYSFSWQPDYVLWSMNGVPLQKRLYDQKIEWTDMAGKRYSRVYRPPDAPSHVSFSMWSDGDQTRAFGGKLDWSQSPFRSYFKGLKRILCDQPLPSDPAAAAAALGPAWLFGGSAGSPPADATAPSAPTPAPAPATPAAPAIPAAAPAPATPAAASGPSLAEVLPGFGKTLTTRVGNKPGYCMTLWRSNKLPPDGLTRLAVYNCSSASLQWAFDPETLVIRHSKAASACLTDSNGEVVVAACSKSAAVPGQQWQLVAGGKLRSKSGVCMGVGGPDTQPYLVSVTCGSAQELSWEAGVADVLKYLQTAKPLVTSNPEAGYCLHASKEGLVASELTPGPLIVRPCLPKPSSNPTWQFQPGTRHIMRKGTKLCLAAAPGAGVSMEPCVAAVASAAGAGGSIGEGMKDQRWVFEGTGHLRSESGACMGLNPAGQVVEVECGGGSEARWSFGGKNPLQSLNPGQTLTASNSGEAAVLSVVLETVDGANAAAWLGLRAPAELSSSSSGESSSVLVWIFNETTSQIVVNGSSGRYAGLCLTSRYDLKAVQLMKCQAKGSQWFKSQVWMWYAGQLKNSGDNKCLALGDENAQEVPGVPLKPVSCSKVPPANKVIWSFGGLSPSP